MKKFKNSTFLCSYFCETTGETKQMYIAASNRIAAYEELCRLYPIAKGGILLYSQRKVIEQI